MKRIILMLFVAFSLNAFSQTTLEEWNYITKGYKIQLESGLDMKKGYVFKDLITSYHKYNGYDRTFNFKELVRLKDNSVAAIMVEFYVYVNGKKSTSSYYCIPKWESSGEIQNLFLAQNQSIASKDFAVAYNWALSQLISRKYL